MKARIRRISASVDTAISFGSSSSSSDACINVSDMNSSTEISHGYNPSSKSLDICVPESRIEKMRKLLSSPLLRRRNASQHGTLCSTHCHMKQQQHQPSSSSSSSPSSSPALGSSSTSSMKTFGVSLESLSHHQHPHHQSHHQHYPEECYVRDTEQVVVPHQKAAHILGQVCPGCLTSAPSNSSSTGSINDSGTGNLYHHSSSHMDDYVSSSASFSMMASPSSGTSSSSTASSASSTGGPNTPCVIPFIVTRLCNYIENSGGMLQEGLFRISGNAKLVEKLKQSFDSTGDASLEVEGDFPSAAALLKQFLRELPQPLIPNGAQFLDVIRSLKNDHETCVLSLKALVSQLPDENYFTLRYLIRFLHRIAQRNDENRMTSTNLGIVFAPNIFRVCVDTYQGLKDQSAANEVVQLLITEYAEIFNEMGDSAAGGGGSSHEDLFSTISCDSESSCPYTCSHNTGIHRCEVQVSSPIDSTTSPMEANEQKGNIKDEGILVDECEGNISVDAKLQLDRKRKDYKSKNHRTIEEFYDDERCHSFNIGENPCTTFKSPPQRCNSDGNNEELPSSTDHIKLASSNNDNRYKQSKSSNQPQEIIITNSSDSVSTDDNTTTTATSTGATVCSVVVGQVTSDDNGDVMSENENNLVTPTTDFKLLNCETISPDSHLKTGRSGSCGSDCTENINIPMSLSFFSDDEDSLSKSIASDCSENSSSSSSSSRCSSNCSGNEGDFSSGNDGQSDGKSGQALKEDSDRPANNVNATYQLLDYKPWINQEDNSEPPLLSLQYGTSAIKQDVEDSVNTDQNNLCSEAPVSPSAFKRYLSNDTSLPLPSYNEETISSKPYIDSSPVLQNDLQKPFKIPALKSRKKRLQSIRRKLKQFEQDFEQENGYKATYEHKMASSFARPLMIELSSILNVGTRNLKDIDNVDFASLENFENSEYRDSLSDKHDEAFALSRTQLNGSWKYAEVNTVPTFTTDDIFYTIFGNPKEKSLAKIREMMEEIQRTLEEKRALIHRPESLDAMTSEQIFDEKLALQKALLRFEALYGRPSSKAERDIVRPVYDRYRMVKRYAAKTIQKLGSKDANNELQPIIENVQMDFTSPTHQLKIQSEKSDLLKSDHKPSKDRPEERACGTSQTACKPDESSDNLENDKNFHEMTQEELFQHLKQLKQQKRNLRSVLRTFENDFFKKSGRRVEKEDRCNMSSVYFSYKNTKGKIRLLEALISKYDTRKSPK